MAHTPELLCHLQELHTTELGLVRIKRNCALTCDDAVQWVREQISLTESKQENMKRTTAFWRSFNRCIKEARLTQSGHWLKLGCMERRNNRLYYFCAIPDCGCILDGFLKKTLPAQTYLVVSHRGMMKDIYDTYTKVYHQLLLSLPYELHQHSLLHFERYDHAFHWNSPNSTIEIWIPIQKESAYSSSCK